jgi:hypothetical protein
MKKVAHTCAKCHDEPDWAEYQPIDPNANARLSASHTSRRNPRRASTPEARKTLSAPSRIEMPAWSMPAPKAATNGMSTTAGIGG